MLDDASAPNDEDEKSVSKERGGRADTRQQQKESRSGGENNYYAMLDEVEA